ncbi:MAG: L-aspartate oxidase [Chitinophagales bacterium]|nr:MAG: L-aspartate oxidase [Chitinophagales bacterium]
MEKRVDFLVVGSGIAGLSYALKVAEKFPDRKVLILTKASEDESNTKYAQGGVAAVVDFEKDSFQKHIDDTLDAGDGLCNPEVVEFCVKEAPDRIREMIQWGTHFDQKESGEFDLGKEGGHTAHRVLHHKDITGKEIERALLHRIHQMPNIEVNTHHFVIDLITQHHLGRIVTRVTRDITCFGVYVLNTQTNQIEKILSRITVLATGGTGQVYKNTTNPLIATGDGIAMVYRAKGRIENMEFIQFHPTALYNPDESPSFLVSEAVRGHGGVLKTTDGREFMHLYDPRKSLAPRDIVARAIDSELKKSGEDHVYLDVRHLKDFREKFPNIYQKCISIGINPEKEMIPVVPAAHYSCGGIKIDYYGRTSIRHLYACGECASSGLHGANRLASNSLLEALVFSHRIFLDSSDEVRHIMYEENIPDWNAEGTIMPKEMVLITQSRKELQEVMSYYVGIVRSNVRLQRAAHRIELLYKETEDLYNTTVLSPQLCELRNLITIGYLITRCSMMRHESRGLHYNTDYPYKKQFAENTLL